MIKTSPNKVQSQLHCSKCGIQFETNKLLNEHCLSVHVPSGLTFETQASPLSKQIKKEIFENSDLRSTNSVLTVKDLNKVIDENKQLKIPDQEPQ